MAKVTFTTLNFIREKFGGIIVVDSFVVNKGLIENNRIFSNKTLRLEQFEKLIPDQKGKEGRR